MTRTTARRAITTALVGASLLLSIPAANAGDYELWREQVPSAQSHSTKLQQTARYSRHSNAALWREQVKEGQYLPVFSTKRLTQADGSYLLWREQVPTGTSTAHGKLIAED